MVELDKQERAIVLELIRNPRISDNAIARATGIPAMTVNRKRKRLEKEGVLWYFVDLNRCDEQYIFPARQLYIIKFRSGITRRQYLDGVAQSRAFRETNARHHAASWLGEKDGHLALVIMLVAKSKAELTEIFHGTVVNGIKKRYGDDCIEEIITCRIDFPLRLHHNYLPAFNMADGKIKKTWKDSWIFID